MWNLPAFCWQDATYPSHVLFGTFSMAECPGFFQVLTSRNQPLILTLNGSDHSLGCSWNKLTAETSWSFDVFRRRHAAVSHLGCFIGGLWTRTPISSHVKQLDWDELGKIDSISQASPMMVETISIFKDFTDYSQYTSKNQVNFLKTNVKINQDYIDKMKSLKDSFNQHTQDMGVVTGRSVFRIFISGDWSRRQVIVLKKNHRPSAASGSFLLRPTRIDIWKSNEWMEPGDRSFHPAMGSSTQSFSQMVDPHGQNELQRFIRNMGGPVTVPCSDVEVL